MMYLGIIMVALFLTGTVFLYFKKLRCYSIYLFCLGYLCLNPGRTNLGVYLLPAFVMTSTVLLTYGKTKKRYINLYLIVPAIMIGFLIYLYSNYAGVVNPRWPVFISTLVLIAAMLLTVYIRKPIWKVVVNFSLIGVVAVSLVLCPTPTYTYAEGKELVSNELGLTVTPPTDEAPHYYSLMTMPQPRKTEMNAACVDQFYVYQTVCEDELAIYQFNNRNDTWVEIQSYSDELDRSGGLGDSRLDFYWLAILYGIFLAVVITGISFIIRGVIRR